MIDAITVEEGEGAAVSDHLEELCRLIEESGLTLTFSANCCSGLVPGGRAECGCWRCRGVEPADEDPEWESKANKLTAAHHEKQMAWARARRVEREAS